MSWLCRPKGEFAAHEINLGFKFISAHIKENPPRVKSLPINIIVAGGAVSTLLFHNRKTTRDVDFWAPDPQTNIIVSEASRAVARRLDYDPFWLNSNMSVFIDTKHTHIGFLERTLKQNVVLYKSDQIVVYAADWYFQLAQKLVRIETMRGGAMRRDQLSDVVYLAKVVLELEEKREMKKMDVRRWYRYTAGIREETFDEVNEEFYDTFGTIAFV